MAEGEKEEKPKTMLSKIFNWHTAVHAGLMAGMVFTGVALLSLTAAAPVTVGDFVVQSGHAVINMVKGLALEGPPMIAEMFNSAASGNFSPTTLDSAHSIASSLLTPEQAIEFSAKADDIGMSLGEYMEGWQPGH